MNRDPDGLKMPEKGENFEFGKVMMAPNVLGKIDGWQIVDFLKRHGKEKADGSVAVVSVYPIEDGEIVYRTDEQRAKTSISFIPRKGAS